MVLLLCSSPAGAYGYALARQYRPAPHSNQVSFLIGDKPLFHAIGFGAFFAFGRGFDERLGLAARFLELLTHRGVL